MSPEWAWGLLFAAGAGYETWSLRGGALRHEHTLSETTRDVFRTRHPVGKAVFIGAWITFAGWFLGHIAFESW